MGRAGTDRRCNRCNEQLYLSVGRPGLSAPTGPLHGLLTLDNSQRLVVIARCGCDHPRINGLIGAPVYEGDIDDEL